MAAFVLPVAALLVAVALLAGNLDLLLMVFFAVSVGAASLFVAVTRRGWMRLAGEIIVLRRDRFIAGAEDHLHGGHQCAGTSQFRFDFRPEGCQRCGQGAQKGTIGTR